MRQGPVQLRVFLSSPGDVTGERTVARTVVDQLQYDPFVRGRVSFDVVAWDQAGGAPLTATETPQASINRGMPRPSECDIVIVILWSRMGTPLPFPEYATPDGAPYLSGTDWEFQDAVRADGPVVLVYRCSAPVLLDPDAPDFDERLRQKRSVDEFFARMRDPRTGAILRGYKPYEAPDDFRNTLERDLRSVVHQYVERVPSHTDGLPPAWEGSPFPGLRAFTTRDAPIYFGRGREADELVARVTASSFVAVVGASGSGKSSLVGAGLLPRLERSGWTLPRHDGSRWSGLRFTPGEAGDDPFLTTALRLVPDGNPAAVASSLRAEPEQVADLLPPGTSLIFVDQFEELFTLVDPAHVEPWVRLLEAAARSGRCRVVVTLRADFYHRCLEIPRLARLLETGQLPLSAPTEGLFDMITRPAARADLTFEDGLPGRILHDTGTDPDALPLLAYTLDELYRASASGGVLDLATYERLGGVQGAIGTRAEHVYVNFLDDTARAAFSRVFRDLVRVDEEGRATRRRALLGNLSGDARRFVEVLTNARLLVQNRDEHNRPVVYVAHEALFGSWERLANWIQATRDDLLLEHKVTTAAADWDRHGRDDAFRWPHERMEPVYAMLARRGTTLDPVTTAFVEPEYDRLFPLLGSTDIRDQENAIDRLVAIGSAAIPGLLEILRSSREQPQDSAAAALGRIGAAAIPGLVEALGHENADTRLAALAALRAANDPRVVSDIAPALHDPDVRVRSAAVGVLKACGTQEAMDLLGFTANNGPHDVRWEAAGALGALGPEAIPSLLAVGDEDQQASEQALRALYVTGDRGMEYLLEGIRHENARVRLNAAATLVAIGRKAAPYIVEALDDEDPDVRWLVCETLAAIDYRGLTEDLIIAADDADTAVRCAALHALGATGERAAVKRLLPALTDNDHVVRWAAADALARIHDSDVARQLRDVGSRPGPACGLALAVWIRHAVPGAPDMRGSRPDWVWHRIADVAILQGGSAVPELMRTLTDPETLERDRHLAAQALAAIGPPAVPGLIEQTRHEHPHVRSAAVRALGWIGRGETARVGPLDDPGAVRALPVLRRLLDDHHCRDAAASALAEFGEDALPLVWQAMLTARTLTREAAARVAAKIGGAAVPGLLTMVHNDVAGHLAIRALREIGTPAALFGLAELGIAP